MTYFWGYFFPFNIQKLYSNAYFETHLLYPNVESIYTHKQPEKEDAHNVCRRDKLRCVQGTDQICDWGKLFKYISTVIKNNLCLTCTAMQIDQNTNTNKWLLPSLHTTNISGYILIHMYLWIYMCHFIVIFLSVPWTHCNPSLLLACLYSLCVYSLLQTHPPFLVCKECGSKYAFAYIFE